MAGMAQPHPAHQNLPALYMAELSVWRGNWGLIVVGPGPEVLLDRADLGPAGDLAVPDWDDPGRHLINLGRVALPEPPVEAAATHLLECGYILAAASKDDQETLSGWVQVGAVEWTAHCRPRG